MALPIPSTVFDTAPPGSRLGVGPDDRLVEGASTDRWFPVLAPREEESWEEVKADRMTPVLDAEMVLAPDGGAIEASDEAVQIGGQVFFVPPACLRRVFVKIESQVFVVPSDRLRARLQRAQDRQPLRLLGHDRPPMCPRRYRRETAFAQAGTKKT